MTKLSNNWLPLVLIVVFFCAWERLEAVVPKSSISFQETLELAEQMVAQNPEWSLYRTLGPSMAGFYGDKSLILVKKTNIRDIRVGMLILYRLPNGDCLAHQVTEHRGGWLRTTGLTNLRPDPVFVKTDMIIGTIFGVLHASGVPSGPVRMSNDKLLPIAYCRKY